LGESRWELVDGRGNSKWNFKGIRFLIELISKAMANPTAPISPFRAE